MWCPVTEINTGIHYIYNISNTFKVAYYLFKVIPRNIV